MNWPDCSGAEGLLKPCRCKDGSFSLWSEDYGQAFHSERGAIQEAQDTFLAPAGLERFAPGSTLRVLELCVGTGTNTAVLLEACQQRQLQLQWWGLELDPQPLQLALADQRFQQQWRHHTVEALKQRTASIHWGDARQTLRGLQSQLVGRCDLVIHDAFSPGVCPQLWSLEFLALVSQCLAPQGRLTTYCSAAAVRQSLLTHGLQLAGLKPHAGSARHQWSGGTVASPSELPLAEPLVALSLMEQEHLRTQAAVPYLDPTGQGTAAEIQEQRRQQQQSSGQLSTSAWRRRWQQGEGLRNAGRFPPS